MTIALIGNPNTGKSTLFNRLTGLRQKVSNYPGVTVEKREGRSGGADGSDLMVLDLPGTYSLTPRSPDEQLAVDVILGRRPETPQPDVIVCVADASNLERNLYLVSQILDLGTPVVVALTMTDVAEERGIRVNHEILSRELGVLVVPVAAHRNKGTAELQQAVGSAKAAPPARRARNLPEAVLREWEELSAMLQSSNRLPEQQAYREARELLTSPNATADRADRYDPELIAHVQKDHQKLAFLGYDPASVFVHSRYAWIRQVYARAHERTLHKGTPTSDRIDRIVTHRFWGLLVFLAVMALVFHSVFTWATFPMEWIGQAFERIGHTVAALLPPGDLRALLVEGALPGVAAVVMFLPQILILFFFLGFLEDSGYMARAAYMMDRLMSRVGLHGKSFIPLLSSFACAIPGIMAARTIDNPKDRLATMLVAPLMSCSARLPVYTLLIGAFIPGISILGFLSLPALTLFGLYVLGLVAALGMAWLLKKTLLKASAPEHLIELPPYQLPSLKTIALQMWERGALFLKNAGTIILFASIILWFLASYPRLQNATASEQLRHSFAGRAGQAIEPLITPIGFNWKIGIGLITSLLQREVFVSTMATIYNVEHADQETGSVSLYQRMRQDRDATTGAASFTTLTAICLMIYYVLSMQCLSTVAVMRRETNGWRWPLFQIAYMTGLAYAATFAVFTVGSRLGWGG